ncbi:MAG: hypothetical protein E7393_07090 [Ruminococcaceae bacterium]|nr:hypothetical protein [Oscillospiraceae bacterium]
MANRYIPFGYEIQNAEIVIVNQEALLVKSAFELYIAGKSYNQIAERFVLSGIRYNPDSAKWNKNMVKRMIENEKYTGLEEYPPIIDAKQYHKANRIRLSKNIKADSDKMEYDKFIRTHGECPACGFRIKRQRQGHDKGAYTAYKCSNPICPAKSIHEETLYEYINEIINRLIDNISLADAEVKMQSRTNESIDELTNEIYIKTIKDDTEKDEILKDIYKLAKIKFKAYTKTDMSKITEKIRQELCKYGISEKAPLPLMETIVSKFYIGGDKGLKIKLINEKILEREG